jgi:hypothetical protein
VERGKRKRSIRWRVKQRYKRAEGGLAGKFFIINEQIERGESKAKLLSRLPAERCVSRLNLGHQRHTLRDRRPSTTGCKLAGHGEKRIDIVYYEEKVFCTGPTKTAKAEQKSLAPTRQAEETN